MKNTGVLAAFGCLAIATAFGDEVLFKSGDRLTGTVDSVIGGKMTFTSKAAGKLTLNMADIKTFSTESPIEIVQTEGPVIMEKVTAAGEGQVAVQPGSGAQPQMIALSNVAKINPEKPHWIGAIVAGATLARGNTESSTASVGADATRRTDKDRTSFGAGYYYANQRDNNTRENSTSADSWFLKGKYDYFFSEKFFGYGNIRYEKDRIANLDMRLTPGVGFGYQWVEKPDLNFNTEGGLTYVHEVYTDPDDTRDYMAARLAYHLDKTLNDHVKGFHNLEIIPNIEDIHAVLVDTDVGLRAAMTERMFLEAKAQLAYNSQPSEDREKKDLRYTLGIGWAF
ncbi:MAG: DUF481 domain-containing protein [bacterium]